MFGRTLLVLLWKHAVVRSKKYIYTSVEFIAPLLLFIFMFIFKNTLIPPSIASHSSDVSFLASNEVLDLVKDTEGPPRNLLYYPDTNFTNAVMAEVAESLGIPRIYKMPGEKQKGVFAYPKNTHLGEFISNMEMGDAIVIFEEMHLPPSIEWPDELSYTIRMKQNFQTQGYMPEDHGPHAMFGLNYLKFMRLQWAIDTAFIKLRSGTPIDQTVHLQEFPFYKTEGSHAVIFVVELVKLSCYLSLLLPFVFLMSRLLEERTSGIQELIKMMGVSLNTLGLSHFLNILPTMLIFSTVVTLLLKITSNPLLPKTNGFLLFLMLFLYFNSLVALAFVCSYLIAGSEYGVTVSVIGYGLLWLPSHFLSQMCTSSSSYSLTIIAGFLPHIPMYWFWSNVRMFEVLGPGLNFSNLTKGAKPCAGSTLLVYVMLILQALIFYTLACYLARVRPGKYGQPLPWNFIFTRKKEVIKITQVSPPISIIDSHVNKQFWTKKQNEVEPELESDTSLELIEREEQYFEKAPEHLKSGIRIENVSKAYRETLALRDVSLNVYQGEITVLLGHNGAGKTTLMNIITGMTSATKGKVYVNDMDTVTDQAEVRKHIGLCPQHNMFFPDLTLQEHIMFFTLLKRGTFQEARESSRKLAQQLNLEHKLRERVAKLSGGMQRRAQLACALAGGADVLVLDEPTSGLDVETRRELWDLLLALRGSRTVLLSTHFMEEADALGDRVAALHAGVLRCHATTMYLKRAVGDGYRLSLTTIGKPKEREITDEVHKHVPDATKKENTINSISYTLPAAANDKFPLLFTELESKRSELGIDSIGVGISTLDEVFMKLCSDVDTTVVDDEVDATTPGLTHERLTGCPLYCRQFMILFKRQIQFALYRKWLFLILQVLLPIILIFIITDLSNNIPVEPDSTRLRMDLNMYKNMGDRRVLYNSPMDVQFRASHIDAEYPGVNFEAVDNVAKHVGHVAQFDMESYHKYLVGIEQVNNTDAKILYTTTVRHAAPVALNMLTNMLAKQYINSPATQISTYNEPVQGFVRAASELLKTKVDELLMFFALFITFFVQATNLHSASLPCRERETGSRHIHIMSGCATELYWFTTLAFHLLIVLLFLVLPVILAVLILEEDDTLNRVNYLGTYSLILLIGSATLFAFIYLTSFYCNERFTNVIQVACLFVFGIVLPLFRHGLDLLELETANTDDATGAFVTFLSFCWFLMPPYTMMVTALRASKLARINALCDEVRKDCPEVFVQEPGWDDTVEDRCCAGLVAKPYFGTENKAPMFGIIMLFIQFAVLMTLVVLTQRGWFNGFHDWIRNRKYEAKERDESDKEVNAEKRYVRHEITKPASSIKKDAILVSNVHKNYPSLFRKSCNAVKGINFSVKKGECFGLLGVNGAGKSTTFKMLTTEECVTRGKIFGNGHFLKRGNTEYLQTLGYCPQFFGLDMFLTGVDNLRLILTLRGHTDAQVKSEVENWISIVGLEKYKLRRAETYSGGCQRRLGAASALCGGAPVSLLDEPSAGVDVAARRRLWAALRKALKQGRSIIITSHSMDEMESLCSRIAILCAGRVRALGSPGTLRAQHAAGHAVVLKVKHALGDEVDSAKSEINSLKGKVKQTFNCDLKDEHKTTLHYHINETMRYSDLFATLEALKKQFPNLIEDYSVTETTLEEVFLSLAQETRAEEERQHQV